MLFVLAGCLLGLVQMAIGIAIGVWLRSSSTDSRNADLRRTRSVALELHRLTQKIGTSVSDHRDRFEKMESRLQESPGGRHNPTTDLVAGVVGEILAANRQLQTELHQAEQQIADQAREIESHMTSALTDPLTKLPNRRALDDQMANRLRDYRKLGTPFSLLMIDVDHFKAINDDFGHQTGDEVLAGMGGVLRASLRRHDFVARYGGEEFAVILPHSSLDEAQCAANKAREGFTQLSDLFAHLKRNITVSGGLATIQPGEELDHLIARADEALYLAKRSGRDRTYMHDGLICRELDEESLTEGNGLDSSAASSAPTKDTLNSLPTSAAMATACSDLRSAVFGSADSAK
ncbi:GGDEF domain-containing protein [Aeoliella mucimassa]|uniref:GGDEF domain-containing protein n=1 Tax=Aeoliella mucimassa TaxID=2527972 RepID=UPI0018D30F70|nr:GGDEF domain-containing protein [Aeoliella mucimassa]